jgi:hypothetical protein
MHRKLDAIADGHADLMEHSANSGDGDLQRDMLELRDTVGVEE